jgi:glyoxylase-like metal-dependent hydrolase (beta-lactamase superfamily II)
VGAEPEQLVEGLWRWTARHPQWHPGEFGREVASFALRGPDVLLLVDPLLPDGDDVAVLATLDEAAGGEPVAILITIPYHARSAEALWRRYRGQGASIHGHANVAKRLSDRSALRPAKPGDALPGGAVAHAIGRPQRTEMPLHLPSHDALAFGDAVVESDGRLRVWSERRVDDGVRAFYAQRFNPTLRPLLELGAERVLVTHGAPVLSGATKALAEALDDEPWYHRPS